MGKQRNWVPKTPADVAAGADEVGIRVDEVEIEPADLARRFGALVVDWILCLLISGLFVDTRHTPWMPSVVLTLEYAFFVGLFTQTPGMFITGIRCVSVAAGGQLAGGRIGIARAAIRGFLLALLVPGVPYGPQRRGWNDRLANSVMIPARKSRSAGS